MYIGKSIQDLIRKFLCFLFIYSSFVFNIHCWERDQKDVYYICGEKK